MSNHRACLALLCALLALAALPPARAEVSDQDQTLVKEVSARLLAAAKPSDAFEWPPSFQIQDAEQINAYASASTSRAAKPPVRVTVTEGMLSQVVERNPDRLAFIIGHELGHILLGHVKRSEKQDATPFLSATFGRQQEYAADVKGMELALAAGYSFEKGIAVVQRMLDLGLGYSSFEGLGADHPSWRDRLVYLDKKQATLWRAMSAFETGTFFLTAEQHVAAESCFRRVTAEFPKCGEAWANLGYALLMQYCDALGVDDLRRLNIGYIACGGFYRRPASLEIQTRTLPEDLWAQAVAALQKALAVDPGLILAKSNLGLAYLIRPAGPDAGKAKETLNATAKEVTKDRNSDPLERAVILLNAGVAGLAAGDRDACIASLDAAQKEFTQAFSRKAQRRRAAPSFEPALLYNRALLAARSKDAKERAGAADAFEAYLKAGSPSSVWWPVAYAEYEAACKEYNRVPASVADLRAESVPTRRAIASVTLPGGRPVSLTEPAAEVIARLGEPESVPIVADTNLRRLRYPKLGAEIIADDQVLAVCLVGPEAPELRVRGLGSGVEPAVLRVGMSRRDLESALGDEVAESRPLADPNVTYKFYRSLGLAVRTDKKTVLELVVAQFPER